MLCIMKPGLSVDPEESSVGSMLREAGIPTARFFTEMISEATTLHSKQRHLPTQV